MLERVKILVLFLGQKNVIILYELTVSYGFVGFVSSVTDINGFSLLRAEDQAKIHEKLAEQKPVASSSSADPNNEPQGYRIEYARTGRAWLGPTLVVNMVNCKGLCFC